MTRPAAARITRLPFSVVLCILLLTALIVALCTILWPHWLGNPDLSHGLFMPLVFLLLLRESRAGSGRFLVLGAGSSLALLLLLFGGLLALAAGGLYAASLGWSHDLVGFTLTGALVLFLSAGLVVFAQDTIRFVPFNWSAFVAIGLWLLCAPLPPGTYMRLTLSLQLMVTENVLSALHLLGIGAVRHGNILELAHASVGIEEACSGVRSLISCIFAGLFFSASLVRRPWSRVLIILLAAPLALVMNFLRSLALTLLANSGVKIGGLWHDLTGFAVLGVTAGILVGVALLLERRARPPRGTGLPTRDGKSPSSGTRAAQPAVRDFRGTSAPVELAEIITQVAPRPPGNAPPILAAALSLAVALCAVFYAKTQPALRHDVSVPDLAAILPETAAGWRVDTATDLYQFSDTLHTEHLAQRTYSRMTDRGPMQIIIYLAYWRPGQASVSLVSSHTPDACWPGAGWQPIPVPDPRVRLALASRQLPVAEARTFQGGENAQNVWFWHLYDGQPITQENPNSPAELLRVAWHYGFRRDGDQLFVRVSSNRPWSDIAQEPVLQTLFARLQPLGL